MSADPDVGVVAPDTEVVAEKEPVTTGAPAEKEEGEEKPAPQYEPPEDLGRFPDDEAPAPGGKGAVPTAEPTPAPAPRYTPPEGPRGDPWGKTVEYTGEDVYAKGSKLVEDHIRERVGALATTVGEVVRDQAAQIKQLRDEIGSLRGQPAAMPRAFVEREHKTAAEHCNKKLREFSADPAWGNQKVRTYMEAGTRQLLKDAAQKGKKGDMSDYGFLMEDGMLDGVFYTAKVRAGYRGGVVPSDVSAPGATLESVRSRGASQSDEDLDLTPEMKAAAKSAGVSLSDLRKQMRAGQKWNKERV